MKYLPSLAREIGRTLGAIHSIPVGTARAAGLTEMHLEDDGRSNWISDRFEVLQFLQGRDPVVIARSNGHGSSRSRWSGRTGRFG